MSSILFLFRRDLRLVDNIGLKKARQQADTLFTAFIVDASHEFWPHRSGDRLHFKLRAVQSLSKEIHEAGGELLIRVGSVPAEVLDLAVELDVDAVYWNRSYEPYERERDREIEQRLAEQQIRCKNFKDQVLFEKQEITTKKQTPYKVFSPYSKRWKSARKPESVGKVLSFRRAQQTKSVPLPGVEELGLERNLADQSFEPSSDGARTRWNQFRQESLVDYDRNRDRPDWDETSKLSPYLRFGLISVRTLYWEAIEIYSEVERTQGIETFVDELIWRDFYHQILWNFPRVATGNFHEKYDLLEWEWDEKHFACWKQGKTGYPLVDAAMRQLNQTGWMHNRLRMIVASFLTKDLLIHWKHGEKYFMRRLLDGDTAANNGGWQWAASTGTDAVPYFRIFNPVSQSEQYDPEGEFIRRYCPELAELPNDQIHAPFQADPGELEAGICLGRQYPGPVVKHSWARERALDRFEAVG